MALSGHSDRRHECPLSGVKRTSRGRKTAPRTLMRRQSENQAQDVVKEKTLKWAAVHLRLARLSRLALAATRLRYWAITLVVDPPVISVTPVPHASLIFSLTILLASARAEDPPAASLASRRAMTRFDSNAKVTAPNQGTLCDLMRDR